MLRVPAGTSTVTFKIATEGIAAHCLFSGRFVG
jgi:hypothetical protein